MKSNSPEGNASLASVEWAFTLAKRLLWWHLFACTIDRRRGHGRSGNPDGDVQTAVVERVSPSTRTGTGRAVRHGSSTPRKKDSEPRPNLLSRQPERRPSEKAGSRVILAARLPDLEFSCRDHVARPQDTSFRRCPDRVGDATKEEDARR